MGIGSRPSSSWTDERIRDLVNGNQRAKTYSLSRSLDLYVRRDGSKTFVITTSMLVRGVRNAPSRHVLGQWPAISAASAIRYAAWCREQADRGINFKTCTHAPSLVSADMLELCTADTWNLPWTKP